MCKKVSLFSIFAINHSSLEAYASKVMIVPQIISTAHAISHQNNIIPLAFRIAIIKLHLVFGIIVQFNTSTKSSKNMTGPI